MKEIGSIMNEYRNRFIKYFDLHFGWFFTNGNKKPSYLKKYNSTQT